MRLGLRLATSGPGATRDGLLDRARALEAAGAEALWVSDHVVQPATIGSRYPYSEDGRASWDPTTPQLDAVAALAAVAAVTESVALGTAVLVLPQRQPVLLAKQLASVTAIARGRLVLGVGAGWLAEEFRALGADFAARGALLDEGIEVLRDCWTGRPRARRSAYLDLPADMIAEPTPPVPVPILVGGMSAAALRRAVRLGDGWIAQAPLDPAGVARVLETAERLRAVARGAGRAPDSLRVAARLSGAVDAERAAPLLHALRDAGIDEAVLDPPAVGEERAGLGALRAALG